GGKKGLHDHAESLNSKLTGSSKKEKTSSKKSAKLKEKATVEAK
ncbi:hypothetical protein M153_40250001, partial [Pseudoloma neurophilia]